MKRAVGRMGLKQRIGSWLRGANYGHRLTRYVETAAQARRWERPPTLLASCPGSRVLVVAPHMDDETVGCGGTVRKMVLEGKEVSVLFMTDGRRGDRDLERLVGEPRAARERALVAIRKQEAAEACGTLGIRETYFLDQEDACLASTEALRASVSDILTRVSADVVMMPFFTDQHHDHQVTAQIVAEVCEAQRWDGLCLAYEVWTPLYPNAVVDISDTVADKRAALSAYRSQLKDNDFMASVLGLNAYRHMVLGGSGFAEAFWMGTGQEYCRLHAWYRGVKRRHDDPAHP